MTFTGTCCIRQENFSLNKQSAESEFQLKSQLNFFFFKYFLGLIKDSDDVSYLLNPTFLIFAEKMTSFPFIKYANNLCLLSFLCLIFPPELQARTQPY